MRDVSGDLEIFDLSKCEICQNRNMCSRHAATQTTKFKLKKREKKKLMIIFLFWSSVQFYIGIYSQSHERHLAKSWSSIKSVIATALTCCLKSQRGDYKRRLKHYILPYTHAWHFIMLSDGCQILSRFRVYHLNSSNCPNSKMFVNALRHSKHENRVEIK